MKNRTALLSGLSLFVCFCLLTGLSRLIIRYVGISPPLLLLAEVLSFALPALLAYYATEDQTAHAEAHLSGGSPRIEPQLQRGSGQENDRNSRLHSRDDSRFCRTRAQEQ